MRCHAAGLSEDGYFNEEVAADYDASTAGLSAPKVLDPTVDFLAELAAGRPVLEFGIGTGRVALPLCQRGVAVHGIDLSASMVEQLKAKPGADAIEVTIGDFAKTQVEGRFGLVYLVFNTIMNLTTQDEQVDCFCNAAAHLDPGGCFVIEVVVPDLRRLPPGESTRVFARAPGYIGFDEYTDLTAAQISYSHHWVADGKKVSVFSAPFRFVWPSELDLMARMAGMTLRERWSSWSREPFTGESTSHISVWERASS